MELAAHLSIDFQTHTVKVSTHLLRCALSRQSQFQDPRRARELKFNQNESKLGILWLRLAILIPRLTRELFQRKTYSIKNYVGHLYSKPLRWRRGGLFKKSPVLSKFIARNFSDLFKVFLTFSTYSPMNLSKFCEEWRIQKLISIVRDHKIAGKGKANLELYELKFTLKLVSL